MSRIIPVMHLAYSANQAFDLDQVKSPNNDHLRNWQLDYCPHYSATRVKVTGYITLQEAVARFGTKDVCDLLLHLTTNAECRVSANPFEPTYEELNPTGQAFISYQEALERYGYKAVEAHLMEIHKEWFEALNQLIYDDATAVAPTDIKEAFAGDQQQPQRPAGLQPPTPAPAPAPLPQDAPAPRKNFYVGQRVMKVTGEYHIKGEVRSIFTKANGVERLVVEHRAEGGGSFLHIYGPDNLEPTL